MMRILIVEDEEHLARLLAEVLGREGHVAETATDGRTALARALVEPFDLLVVDWMLRDLDGIQVVKRLRAADVRVPILMLTARAQVEDRVEGLDAGADDYLPKPFAFPELLARVRALSRRPREKEAEETVLTVGDVALDPVRHEVRRAGERVDLTAKEFALLATLMQRPGQVFTRSVLLDTVWGGTTGAYTNVVDLYIHYLRKKLDAGEALSRIRTVHGTGYTFDPRPEYLGQASSRAGTTGNLMLEKMRWRLTLGYAGIFALILIFLAIAAVAGFSRELTNQQDTLLTQEAKDLERNLLDGDHREVLAEGSAEYSWVALDTEGRVTDRDPTAATLGTLGLPSKALARQSLEEDERVGLRDNSRTAEQGEGREHAHARGVGRGSWGHSVRAFPRKGAADDQQARPRPAAPGAR